MIPIGTTIVYSNYIVPILTHTQYFSTTDIIISTTLHTVYVVCELRVEIELRERYW